MKKGLRLSKMVGLLVYRETCGLGKSVRMAIVLRFMRNLTQSARREFLTKGIGRGHRGG
jgi:hypothetical protein